MLRHGVFRDVRIGYSEPQRALTVATLDKKTLDEKVTLAYYSVRGVIVNTKQAEYYGVFAGEKLVTVCHTRDEANAWILTTGDAYPDLVARPLPPMVVTTPQATGDLLRC